MLSLFRTRAKARALIGVALAGAILGVMVAGAYLAGVQAKAAEQQARIGPLAAAAQTGYAAAANAPTPHAIPLADNVQPSAPPPVAAPVRPAPASPFHLTGALETSRDLDCLAAAVYYEARGESLDGQAAVAQVVLNRARQPSFPKSVCGVVFQGVEAHGCQFSFVCNGAMRAVREPGPWLRAKTVAARALGGYVMAAVGRATSFHAARLGGSERAVTQVGGHVFFASAGRAGDTRRVFVAETKPADVPEPSPRTVTPVIAKPSPSPAAITAAVGPSSSSTAS